MAAEYDIAALKASLVQQLGTRRRSIRCALSSGSPHPRSHRRSLGYLGLRQLPAEPDGFGPDRPPGLSRRRGDEIFPVDGPRCPSGCRPRPAPAAGPASTTASCTRKASTARTTGAKRRRYRPAVVIPHGLGVAGLGRQPLAAAAPAPPAPLTRAQQGDQRPVAAVPRRRLAVGQHLVFLHQPAAHRVAQHGLLPGANRCPCRG